MTGSSSDNGGGSEDERIAELAAEFADRCRRGERPSIEEYAHAHPAFAVKIRETFPVIRAMESAAGPSPTPQIGAMIGRYRLIEHIGDGGFGSVFLAEQQVPVRRRVALKLIKLGLETSQVIARFEAERQALALMDHEHIAKVLDAGATESGRPYFVMELVRGVPITEYCDANHLSPRQRLELFVKVCAAVQHAHTKGVIHRDIKPTNVLVTERDGMPVPKVIDFGVAKATGQQLTDATLFTNIAQMIGTPLYMSPEQAAMGGLDIDTRSDIYSLGVLLYELLTGTTPVDKDRLKQAAFDEVRRIIREEEPPKPSTRLSTVAALPSASIERGPELRKLSSLLRGELDWIVMKCLEKERHRRYESAGELAADAQRYLADEPITVRPATLRYRAQKFAQRHRLGVTIAMTFAVLLIASAVAAVWIERAAHRREILALKKHNRAQQAFYDVSRVLPEIAVRQFFDGQYDEAVATYEKVLALARELYAPGEMEMVHMRLKYSTMVAGTRRFAVAERVIADAVADSKSRGTFDAWTEYEACHRLEYLYFLAGQPEKAIAATQRMAELQSQIPIKVGLKQRIPLRSSPRSSTTTKAGMPAAPH